MQLRKLLSLAIALTALVAAACSSGGSAPRTATVTTPSPTALAPTATATVTPTATATVVPTPAPSALALLIAADAASRDNAELALVLLDHVPDTEQARSGFWIADYALAAHLLGIPRPDPADATAVSQYVTSLGLADTHVPPGLYLAGFSTRPGLHPARHAARQSVGFAQGDITYGITVGEADSALEIVFGDIDPEVVRTRSSYPAAHARNQSSFRTPALTTSHGGGTPSGAWRTALPRRCSMTQAQADVLR